MVRSITSLTLKSTRNLLFNNVLSRNNRHRGTTVFEKDHKLCSTFTSLYRCLLLYFFPFLPFVSSLLFNVTGLVLTITLISNSTFINFLNRRCLFYSSLPIILPLHQKPRFEVNDLQSLMGTGTNIETRFMNSSETETYE